MKEPNETETRTQPRMGTQMTVVYVSACRLLYLLSLLTWSWMLCATTLEKMSIRRMACVAPLIVRARCISNATKWDAGEIWTFTSFEVAEPWKGSAPERITVRLLGGTVGSLTSTVSGVPRFRPGEHVILFLQPTSRGAYSIVSWQQGTFRVHSRSVAHATEETVTQDTAAFATFDPQTRRFETTGARDLSLSAFRAQVQSAIGAMENRP